LYCLGAVITCVISGMYFASKYESIHRLALYYEAKLEKVLSFSDSEDMDAPGDGWLDEDLELSTDEPADGWLDTTDDNWEDTSSALSLTTPKDGWLDDDYQIGADEDNATENVQISPDDWEEDPGQTKNHGGRQS
jgi:hypothetical protein